MDGNNTPMVYESGQAQRPLSMILRNSSAFSFTLFAQTVDGEFAFFQSGMLRIPSAQISTTLDDVVVYFGPEWQGRHAVGKGDRQLPAVAGNTVRN